LTSTIIFSKKKTPLNNCLFLITLEIDDKLCFFLGLHDQLQCPECSYRGEKSQNVARHIALVHSKLDALLADKNLVNKRRQEYQSKPNKINIGSECPVCDQQLTKQHSRVHVIWHFMEELREIVQTFADPTVSYHFR
jgi:hypothetical protein